VDGEPSAQDEAPEEDTSSEAAPEEEREENP
jgi:hypothetical protein